MSGKEFVAKGKIVRVTAGTMERPETIGLILRDSEGKLFQKEEVLLTGKVFLEHLMKAMQYTHGSEFRNLEVKIEFT